MKSLKRKYFELWADEESQNYILKWMLIGAVSLISIETSAICILALRTQTIIAISEKSTQILAPNKPSVEILKNELERFVEKYAVTHYTWDFKTIENAHKEAAKFVADKFQKAYFEANAQQVKQVKEKKISQVVYRSRPIEINTDKLTAKIFLDRIFSIDGIKATVPIALEISFEYGPRTNLNPEGIYISDEKLILTEDTQN